LRIKHASTLISSGNETFPVSTEKLVAFGETETSQIFCLEDASSLNYDFGLILRESIQFYSL